VWIESVIEFVGGFYGLKDCGLETYFNNKNKDTDLNSSHSHAYVCMIKIMDDSLC
jgi:hypothetical protein